MLFVERRVIYDYDKSQLISSMLGVDALERVIFLLTNEMLDFIR